MNNISCIYKIHELLPGLSNKERQIADYILVAPQESVNPSIEELADRIGVSDSTLFRFVRKLGYGGYQEFRIALATESVDPQHRVYEAELNTIDEQSAMSIVFKTNILALERTMATLDTHDLQLAAENLISARRITFYGLGGSAVVAQDLYHKLVRTGLPCAAPLDFHMQLMQASQGTAEDVGLLISHTGVNKDALAIAEEIKNAETKLIVLTDYGRSPLAKIADLSLFVHTPTTLYATEAFSGRIVQLAIVDCLYVLVMEKLGSIGHDPLERMRKTIAKRRT
ncbi:MurR/RpiR family transcriptional regulator [Treponema sp.]